MKICDNIRESLGAWLDGELSPSESEAVRAHVNACPVCREERRQLEALNASVNKALASAAEPIRFEALWRGVERRILEKQPWYAEWIEWGRGLIGGPALAWGIPAVIGLLIALYSMGIWKDETPRNNFATVESIDAYGRNVALLRENETRTTVIWLYQNQEGENENAGQASDNSPTF
jgi:anti-sigma factor RsiW